MHIDTYIGMLLVGIKDFFTKLMVHTTKKVGNRYVRWLVLATIDSKILKKL